MNGKESSVSPGIVWEEVDGETVVVDMTRQQTWILNSTATRLWKLLTGQIKASAVLRRLSKECGQPVSTLRSEVERFRAQLAGVGLIKGTEGSGTVFGQSMLSPPPGLSLFQARRPQKPIKPTGETVP